MLNKDIEKRFHTNTDDTGRFTVRSDRTGRTYFVEPIVMEKPVAWGSVDPSDQSGNTKNLMHKKGDGKYRGGIDKEESLITEENGFKNIRLLDKGTSPLLAIEAIDAQYPDA